MSETENILVLNAGSSSLRFAVFDESPARVLSGKFDRIGLPKSVFMTQAIQDALIEHREYIDAHGDDTPEIRNWKWSGNGTGRATRSSTEADNA
jgi:acetate kinase